MIIIYCITLILATITLTFSLNNVILLFNFISITLILAFSLLVFNFISITLLILIIYSSLMSILFLVNGLLVTSSFNYRLFWNDFGLLMNHLDISFSLFSICSIYVSFFIIYSIYVSSFLIIFALFIEFFNLILLKYIEFLFFIFVFFINNFGSLFFLIILYLPLSSLFIQFRIFFSINDLFYSSPVFISFILFMITFIFISRLSLSSIYLFGFLYSLYSLFSYSLFFYLSSFLYLYLFQSIFYLDSFSTLYLCFRHSFHFLNLGFNRVGNLVFDNSLFIFIVFFFIVGMININLLFMV